MHLSLRLAPYASVFFTLPPIPTNRGCRQLCAPYPLVTERTAKGRGSRLSRRLLTPHFSLSAFYVCILSHWSCLDSTTILPTLKSTLPLLSL